MNFIIKLSIFAIAVVVADPIQDNPASTPTTPTTTSNPSPKPAAIVEPKRPEAQVNHKKPGQVSAKPKPT